MKITLETPGTPFSAQIRSPGLYKIGGLEGYKGDDTRLVITKVNSHLSLPKESIVGILYEARKKDTPSPYEDLIKYPIIVLMQEDKARFFDSSKLEGITDLPEAFGGWRENDLTVNRKYKNGEINFRGLRFRMFIE